MMDEQKDKGRSHGEVLKLTTDVVASYLEHHDVATDQIASLINMIYGSLRDLASGVVDLKIEPPKPAVPVRKSVTAEYIVCLEDGKRLKMLKRHLRTMYNMSPDEYRAKWGLPQDYPMVAPNYAKQRSEFAKQIGLGRSAVPEGETPTPARRRRGA